MWQLHTLQRMSSAGRLPAPLRFGGHPRWRRKEILEWIDAGCPSREIWEVLKSKSHV
jgi:predicted DNA-binding transcriptional regulator AlpA